MVNVGHEMFEPRSCKAHMAELPCQGFCLEDGETFSVRSPSCGEVGAEHVEEILWSIHCEAMSVDDVPKDMIDGADNRLLKFVKGDGILPLVQCGRAKEDENSFNAGGRSPFDTNDIEKIDVDPVINIDKVRSGGECPKRGAG